MTRPSKTSSRSPLFVLLASLLIMAGCAAPQAANNLQQRIEELLRVQQQQSEQLSQLQHQFAALQGQQPQLPPQPLSPALQPSNPEMPTDLAGTASLATPASAAETTEISAASQLYLEAFAAIATGQMPKAQSDFQAFIERFPKHKYVGNANFWLAEALLAQQKNQRAINVLRAIINNPQQQNKAPAAMARLISYYRANNTVDKAVDMLQTLSNKYPESPEFKRLQRVNEPR
ncbi:MAG: tetratricopeptide repeat protein [Geopsychrobacter sp.]|nr:tetratricopeptide repeat protein [Geopsychrobacter sp.]